MRVPGEAESLMVASHAHRFVQTAPAQDRRAPFGCECGATRDWPTVFDPEAKRTGGHPPAWGTPEASQKAHAARRRARQLAREFDILTEVNDDEVASVASV